VGLIFYILGALVFILLILVIGLFPLIDSSKNISDSISSIGQLGLILFGMPLAIIVGFSFWSWITLDKVRKGLYFEARTSALVLDIFGLMFAWVIGGIFFALSI